MNVFETHSRIISDYENYITSFINISDREISDKVEAALREGKLWPKPLLQFNPAYEQAGTVEAFAQSGVLHTSLPAILKGYSLYHHQISAMRLRISLSPLVPAPVSLSPTSGRFLITS
jgi:ATP-dependent helicase YprA (DUF1998 family)